MINQIFGKWTVLKEAENCEKKGGKYYECKCICGNIGFVRYDHLIKGNSKGCQTCNERRSVHGYSRTSIYRIWQGMLARCYNNKSQSFYLYGERGINVDNRWHKFENFLADMGERPEKMCLDRIDPDGNYCPENCRWTTPQENLKNRRVSKKHSGKYLYVKKELLCAECLNTFIKYPKD